MGILTMRITSTAFVLLIQTFVCLASNDSQFQLINRATGFCLVKLNNHCNDIRWTSGDRLLVQYKNKCLGVQGKTVGSEVNLYDCDETSELQKWECKNETVIALKGQELYIDLTADNTAVLSNKVVPSSHLTISGTSSGACTRTYTELYTIEGNAAGRPCMFPFFYKSIWYSECTAIESPGNRKWCAVETKYDHELWGYCPTNSKETWNKDPTTGASYQLNTQSALTWDQADASCKQQSASLLSISNPHEQAYISALLGANWGQEYKLWVGLSFQDLDYVWKWSNGNPYAYLNWDSGHPVSNPGYKCGIIDGTVQFSWQSSKCNKKLGYICYSEGPLDAPTEAPESGFCTAPWIPYNGHCFYLYRNETKKWSDAQKACRKEEGDLVSIRNVEDQSFIISQLGYASTDELWIGLNDRKRERLFVWSDHSPVSYTSWDSREPTVTSEQEDCVLIRGENGNWADRVCDEKHGFICMKTSDSEPSGDEVELNAGCKTGWKRHGSYCYFVGTETKTFHEANDDCKSSNSYLADVSTGVDNNFLVSLVGLRPEKHFWIGLSNLKNREYFMWTNNAYPRYTHWNTHMPGHVQGCVAMATGHSAGLWDVLPCTNKEKYICKHLAEGAALTPAPPTTATPNCTDGWIKMQSRGICYKIFPEASEKRKTWYEARDYCRAIGGDLVSIHSSADLLRTYNNIYNHWPNQYWIGLSAPDPDTGYVWSDRSPVNFQDWKDGEPNNKNNAELCVEVERVYWDNIFLWSDVPCEKYNNWICQIHAGVTPKPAPDPVTPEYNTTSDGWLEWNGAQYYINEKAMAMEDARTFCRQRHGDLVSINSEAERIFLWKQISTGHQNSWIGLSVDLDGTFQWMDGSQVVFQRWDENQPEFKNFDENCAVMTHHNGFWHDSNCGLEYMSFCKRSSSTPTNTTAAVPTVSPKGGCPPPWKKFNSKCYIIFKNQNLTWQDAREKCKQKGGQLASITSRQVEVFLLSQMVDAPTTDLWIGLIWSQWKTYWTDGQPKSYTNLGNNHWYWYDQMKNCFVINTKPLVGIGKWIQKSCNDTNGFICHRNLDTSQPDSPEPTISTNYIKILNDSIKVVPQQMNWDKAAEYCKNDDALLASLRNEWMQAYVELMALNLKAPLWFGLHKVQINGSFRYVDGWHLIFSRWGTNEPRKDRSCVYMDVDGKWKTAHCNETLMSVCMKSTDVLPTESTIFPGVCPQDPEATIENKNYIWVPFRGYCYIFITEQTHWREASTTCVAHGGMLASIEDSSEQKFLEINLRTFQDGYTSFWIGLFKKQHKEEWLWVDRTAMGYTNWAEGQPFNMSFGSRTGEISTSDGTWKDIGIWDYRPYICKTPKVLLPTPSPPAQTGLPHHQRVYITTAVVLVITGIAVVAVTAVFIFKKFGHQLPAPNTFDNPLFFSSRVSQPEQADTSILVENAAEENTGDLISM
ncbi:macrophage mannose receptor 1-like isoform X1 [Simochromis diagramma]|uniref:macrophage mannose receptor 1-like isoform X1 n=1 Tax=Simochromis diagramma TaxID=43689 RepID=UPI001A7E72E8|nr:macrophage mannose receptor 1-like isoform X1 [Simochromis diagramma]